MQGGAICLDAVLASLLDRRFIDIDTFHFRFRTTLHEHACNQSTPGTDIQDAYDLRSVGYGYGRPCAQQNTIGAYLHGAAVVTQIELLELKAFGASHCLVVVMMIGGKLDMEELMVMMLVRGVGNAMYRQVYTGQQEEHGAYMAKPFLKGAQFGS